LRRCPGSVAARHSRVEPGHAANLPLPSPGAREPTAVLDFEDALAGNWGCCRAASAGVTRRDRRHRLGRGNPSQGDLTSCQGRLSTSCRQRLDRCRQGCWQGRRKRQHQCRPGNTVKYSARRQFRRGAGVGPDPLDGGFPNNTWVFFVAIRRPIGVLSRTPPILWM